MNPLLPPLADLDDPQSLVRALLDQMTEGVSLSREDGTIVYTNPAEDALFGYEPGELLGRHVSVQNAYPPEENDRVVAEVIARLRESGTWVGEWRNRRKDGSEFVTRSRISAVLIGDERHWLCVQEDVTEERAALADLAAERARLKLATEAGGIGVWDWDLRTGRMTYSDRAKEICGFPPDRPVSFDDARRVTHPEDLPHTTALSRRALDPAIRDRTPFEYRLRRDDGSVRWVLAYGEAIFEDGDGAARAVRFVGTMQDVTEKREQEEEQRRAAQRLRLAVDAGRMGVWDLDVASGLVNASPETSRLLGFPEGEPIVAELANARYAPGERERVSGEGAAALARGDAANEVEFEYVHPERGRIWLRLRYEVMFDAAGQPSRLIGVMSDETERRRAEAQLRESEQELRALADALPILVCFIDLEGRYRFMNQLHERWLGRPREEMLGRTIREVLGEDAFRPREPHIQAALRGEATRVETFTPAAGGVRRDAEIHYIPRRGAGGEVDGLYAVAVDLTEQKAAQRALQEAREGAEREAARAAAILSQLAEGVIVTDGEGRITFVNEAATRLHGVDRLDVTPDHYAETYHLFRENGRPHPPRELPLARAALHGETVEDARWRIRRPDGSEVLAVGAARPLRAPDGRHAGAVLTLRDDTARAAAEAELRRLNEDLEAEVAQRTAERDRIWQNSNELMAVFGFDGRRRAINPAWTRLLGHDEETLLTTPFMDLTHPEDRPRLAEAVERLRRGERVVDFEDRLRHRDGSWRTVSWTGVPGEGVFYAIGRDVTDQREAEAALRQSQKMEALGQLTGGIAHDFNNLLQAVQGSFALILKRPADAGRVQGLAEQGLAATRRGGSLAAQLLAFSRSQKLEMQAVPVGEALAGMEALLRRTLGPMTTVGLEPVEPGLVALVDPTQLEMAILNLSINARDAMPEGGTIAIRAGTRRVGVDPEVSPGDYVLIEVRDTGGGMTPEVARRAFEPFFTTKGLGKGTGLGLSQVYAMARQSGGTVRLDSEPGRGTTVTILLPRAAGEAPAEEPGPEEAGGEGGPEPGATVLVVDDDNDVRRWLCTAIALLGHRVVDAADGPSGLRALEAGADLLLVDFAMPGMTGAEVVQAARRLRPDLPVILATGYADTGALETLADPDLVVLRKPFELEELEAALRDGLSRRAEGASRPHAVPQDGAPTP